MERIKMSTAKSVTTIKFFACFFVKILTMTIANTKFASKIEIKIVVILSGIIRIMNESLNLNL